MRIRILVYAEVVELTDAHLLLYPQREEEKEEDKTVQVFLGDPELRQHTVFAIIMIARTRAKRQGLCKARRN